LHNGCRVRGYNQGGNDRAGGTIFGRGNCQDWLPIEERTVAGKKVYIWGSLEMPTKAPKEKKCQIRATMNGDLIESFDYQGDESLCQRYAERLRP
jgi:hypothetical protein